MRRCAGYRVWAIVWAVLQLALPAVTTIADAQLERASEVAGLSHVESSTTAACRPVHPAECALCQYVSHTGTPTDSAPCVLVARDVDLPPAAATIASATNALSRLHPARAPPTRLTA